MASKEKNTAEVARYQVDLEWYKQNEKDLAGVLTSRRCSNCRKDIGSTPDKYPSVKEHFTQFNKCCGTKDEYLGEYMSIKEIVFRILVRDRNQPKTIDSIYKSVASHLQSRSYSRVITASWLTKMLDDDQTYGIHAA